MSNSYNTHDLKKIKRTVATVAQNTNMMESTSQNICYDVTNIEEIKLHRQSDEGFQPIFRRADIVVNKYEHEDTNCDKMNTLSKGQTRSILEVSEDEIDLPNTSSMTANTKSPTKEVLKELEESFSDIQMHLQNIKSTRNNQTQSANYFKKYLSKIKTISDDLKNNLTKNDLAGAKSRKKRRRSYSSEDSSDIDRRRTLKKSKKTYQRRAKSPDSSNDSSYDERKYCSAKRSLSPIQSRDSSSDSDGRSRARKAHRQRSYSRGRSDRYRESSSRRQSRRSYSSYSRDYYGDVVEQEDIELRYHRYNAAMCAISVILEIIMQNAM